MGCLRQTPSLQGSGNYGVEEVETLQDSEEMDDTKETVSSRHNRTDNTPELPKTVMYKPEQVQDR